MTGPEFISICADCGVTASEVAKLVGKSARTAKRWEKAKSVPGPLAAMMHAWRRSISVGLSFTVGDTVFFPRDVGVSQ